MRRALLIAAVVLVASPIFVWAGDGTWDNADGGFWHDSRNWAPAVPNGIGDVASFPDRRSSPPIDVHLDRPTTIGQLDVDYSNLLTITGDNPLTLDVAGADGTAFMISLKSGGDTRSRSCPRTPY